MGRAGDGQLNDWLGVRRNGRYVIGRPRLSPVPPDDDTVPDDRQDLHRIEFLVVRALPRLI